MAAGMTYDSLITDLQNYAERADQAFIDQLPRFLMLAENRIARECKNLGFVPPVTSTFLTGGTAMLVQKPARWRATLSWNYGTGASLAAANTRNNIFQRSYEFCRNYWPDPTLTGPPVYYADYDFNNWLIVPTPDQAYPFELLYYERVVPLDSAAQTNWLTDFAPDLLLYACMVEMAPYLKKFDIMSQYWEGRYQAAKTEIEGEDVKRMADRSEKRAPAA